MSLTLPANFEKDIQGRDTNLVPLVVIGNADNWVAGRPDIALSTNDITIDIL